MNVHEELSSCGLSVDQVLDLAGQVAAASFARDGDKQISQPSDAERFFRPFLAGRPEEILAAAFLDTKHSVIKLEAVFRGTIDGAAVYPRVIAERALRYGAAAVIVAHNHPSGVAKASVADQAITQRLKEALGLLDIRLVDSLVIGDKETASAMALADGAITEKAPKKAKKWGIDFDELDNLERNLAQVEAMVEVIHGGGGETFHNWAGFIKDNYLWAVCDKIKEARRATAALIPARGKARKAA